MMLPKRTRIGRVRWDFVMLVALTTSGCSSCSGNGEPDADLDADASDADRGADADAERDADPDQRDGGDADVDADRDRDADPDLLSGLCDDAGPAWTWHPYECGDEPNPPDCCPSCRRLTCRQPVPGAYSIWGDKVAVRAGADVAIVDLSTGEDVLAFDSYLMGSGSVGYGPASISSRYIVSNKIDTSVAGRIYASVVARRLDDLTGPQIQLVEPSADDFILWPQVSEEWVLWIRQPPSGRDELILHNIETGEQRVLDTNEGGHGARVAGIDGDRVVWGAMNEVAEREYVDTLTEHRISTGVTREVLTSAELTPMYSMSVWGHYAVFNHQPEAGDWNGILVDLDTGETRQITPSGSNQDQVSIGGGTIVWTDFRGSSGGGPAGMHVYVYSLTTGREYVLNPSAMGGSEPLVYGRNVVWNGPTDVWVTQIGDI